MIWCYICMIMDVKKKIMVQGDDGIAFLLWNHDWTVERVYNRIYEICLSAGHKIELQDNGYNYDELEYCSSTFWPYAGSRVKVPKIGRMVAKGWMPHEIYSESNLRPYMAGVALGFKNYGFVPVLRELCYAIVRDCLDENKYIKYIDPNPYRNLLKTELPPDGTNAAEEYFAQRYGLDPNDLIQRIMNTKWTYNMVCSNSDMDIIMMIDGVMIKPQQVHQ